MSSRKTNRRDTFVTGAIRALPPHTRWPQPDDQNGAPEKILLFAGG